jgi:hypothetical protein
MGLLSLILPFLASRKENLMKSAQALHLQLQTLHRTLQAHYNAIAYQKGGANLVAAFFNPQLRRQSLQSVANARQQIEYTLLQIQDVQEQQVAALFLECWQEELQALPDSVFLPTK